MNTRDNASAWESEYNNPQFLTLGIEPAAVVRDAMSWMKKDFRKKRTDPEQSFILDTVLDLGCGNGKNLKYVVQHYADRGIGYDISETAIHQAQHLAEGMNITYQVRSIGERFQIDKESIDLVMDITASNSLTEPEREVFLSETYKVLKPGGIFLSRMLCLDGDKNAKFLIAENPGTQYHTYILPVVNITERVVSRADIDETYGKYFNILHIEKTTGYQRWDDRSFKRNYWVVYFGKK